MIVFDTVFMPRDRIDGASHRVVREKEHGTELLNELGRPAFAFPTPDGCGRHDSSGRSRRELRPPLGVALEVLSRAFLRYRAPGHSFPNPFRDLLRNLESRSPTPEFQSGRSARLTRLCVSATVRIDRAHRAPLESHGALYASIGEFDPCSLQVPLGLPLCPWSPVPPPV